MLVLSSKYNIEQVAFTDWMSFQTSNLIEEIRKNKKLFKYECFNIVNCITYTGNKYTQFLAVTIVNDWILVLNFKNCKETYILPYAIRTLRRN